MASKTQFVKTSGGLKVVAYAGDNMVLLAFSLDENKLKLHDGLAGFAIRRTQGRKTDWLMNRLSFEHRITNKTTPEKRVWTESNVAPFQKFRWVDVPPETVRGKLKYEVTARYFKGDNDLVDGPSVTIDVDFSGHQFKKFEVAFTRGYIASQAYADKFGNAKIRPAKKTLSFPTKPFEKQYEWLGADARKAINEFLDQCMKNKSTQVDVEAYDLDEPDFIATLEQLGKQKRLRLILDNASLHTKKGALEVQAKKRLIAAAGAENVKVGRFKRFAHNKVIIQRDGSGKAIRVLTGSANFSIRGLYVQANNVIVIDDPETAARYAEAFDAGFSLMPKFSSQPIAQQYFEFSGAGLPDYAVAFSPHKTADISLAEPAKRINGAKSSVFFAIMGLDGGGAVLDAIRALPSRPKVFSYGTSQSAKGLGLTKPGARREVFTTFAALTKAVPAPFRKEWSGGSGQTIHHKFIVIDFNGADPVVYTGSSNLAAGGEKENGDNLIEIRDASLAVAYAVEAIRLFDHYHFRSAVKTATKVKPLVLQNFDAPTPWWKPYYTVGDVKLRDRKLFSLE